ncbi:MAG: HipA domain-containing protein [Clostridia bacterium]|nr:HipA domain-containing protein [Clostridia bacterium]
MKTDFPTTINFPLFSRKTSACRPRNSARDGNERKKEYKSFLKQSQKKHKRHRLIPICITLGSKIEVHIKRITASFIQNIRISANVKKNMYKAFLRMCFNVFYQNKDDHGKNFAFLYDDNLDGYTLSPAYDLTKTPEKYEHEMTVNGIGNPTKKDLLAVAEQFKLSKTKCKEIIDLTEYFCK